MNLFLRHITVGVILGMANLAAYSAENSTAPAKPDTPPANIDDIH